VPKKITIYSFADVDRSGKARWTACELGYEIEEIRVAPGDHRGKEYLRINPYAQVPTVVLDGETWIESTAICILLAERHPEADLIPADAGLRTKFWQLVNVAATTLELPVVNYFLASRGIADESWKDLVGGDIAERMKTFASGMPGTGYVCGTFSIADICAAYILRIAVQAGLLTYEGMLAEYLDRLRARPAAADARIFSSLDS
jgi:glutathione S-transferase